LLGLGGATEILVELIGDKTFEELPIPFAVVAVDVENGQEITINEGSLFDAILATIAVPGILPARRWAGRVLVDGGVANPVPVDIARNLRPELPVVAVVLSEPVGKTHTLKVPAIPVAAPVVEYISRLRIAKALEIFILSLEAGSKNLAEKRLELDRPDVIIRPPVGDIGLLDRIDVIKVADIGYTAALEQQEALLALDSLSNRVRRMFKRGSSS
jgi:NTE family protein